MYYNSNKSSNDYYNSYKKELEELEAYKKEESTQKVIKLILSFFALMLLMVATFYLYQYFNPTINSKDSLISNEKVFSKNQKLPAIVIREEELPQSIQLLESNMKMAENIQMNATDTKQEITEQKNQRTLSAMNEKDIALIVQIIMSQMNAKVEKPLEQQLQEVNDKIFTNKDLKKMNHYNKIVLTKNEQSKVENASLMALSDNIYSITNEVANSNSEYTQAIAKELFSRKNEMRVIIVQEGDTLSRIAKKAYGHSDDYSKIFAANPEVIKNPNQIFVGQRLRIPS